LVGIYFMVYRLVFAAQMVTQHGMSDVAMVVLSSMHQDTMLYRRGLLRALRLMLFVCACAFGLLSVAGPWLIPLVFGPQWAPATAPLQVLAAFSTGGAVVSIAGTILVASGYAQAFSRLAVGSAFGQLVAVALAARWGLVAVAWAAGLAQCIAIWPALRMLSQHYHLRVRTLCAEIAPIALLLGASMGLAVWLDRFAGPARWFMHPTASFGFCVLMAIGALALLRKEKERMSRPPDRY
jgi:PST family polysaccharide transporter